MRPQLPNPVFPDEEDRHCDAWLSLLNTTMVSRGTPVVMQASSRDDICATSPVAQVSRGNSNMMQGGRETRPRNIYVMYCIFAGHAPLPRQVKFFAD
jgi:hypothetical protein